MCPRCAVSRRVSPECAEARLRSEQGWPSGMPCCRVWCRLEMIVERSLSRLRKGKEREGEGEYLTGCKRCVTQTKSTQQTSVLFGETKMNLSNEHEVTAQFHHTTQKKAIKHSRPATLRRYSCQVSSLEAETRSAFGSFALLLRSLSFGF